MSVSTELKIKILNKTNFFSFIHMADSHNGHRGNTSKYNEFSSLKITKTTNTGINIRQKDIEEAFDEIIDVALELEVGAVLHAGDGWDAVGFPDRTVDNHYTKAVSKLNSKEIPYIEIVGNHNLPKIVGKGCFLETLGRFPNVYTIYKGAYERIELNDHVHIHCVPSTFSQDILNNSLDAIANNTDGNKINIGLGHFGLTNIPFYAESNEKSLFTTLDKLLKLKLNYFALGDFHKATIFENWIRYSGSIVRLGIDEVNNSPLVYVCAINKFTKEMHVEPYYLKTRPMFDLGPIEASGKTIDEINEEIISLLSSKNLKDSITRLIIVKLPVHLKSSLNYDFISEATIDTLHFKLELKDKVDNSLNIRTTDDIEFEGILDGWVAYMKKIEDDKTYDKDFVTKKGYEKLKEVLER